MVELGGAIVMFHQLHQGSVAPGEYIDYAASKGAVDT